MSIVPHRLSHFNANANQHYTYYVMPHTTCKLATIDGGT